MRLWDQLISGPLPAMAFLSTAQASAPPSHNCNYEWTCFRERKKKIGDNKPDQEAKSHIG